MKTSACMEVWNRAAEGQVECDRVLCCVHEELEVPIPLCENQDDKIEWALKFVQVSEVFPFLS